MTLSTALYSILAVATILGGIAAIGYFRDKWRAKQHLREEEKVVNSAWWESSNLKTEYEAKGYGSFAWSNSDKVEERVAFGKEIVYEVDEKHGVKYKLVNSSGQVLMCHAGA